jgi:hypothetical protein
MEINPFSFVLLINSILPIGLILNQNDNTKDSSGGNQMKFDQSNPNPLEILTWFTLSFQLILLLIRTKIIDY